MKLRDKLDRLRMPGASLAHVVARTQASAEPEQVDSVIEHTSVEHTLVEHASVEHTSVEHEHASVEHERLSTIRGLRARLEAMRGPAPGRAPLSARVRAATHASALDASRAGVPDASRAGALDASLRATSSLAGGEPLAAPSRARVPSRVDPTLPGERTDTPLGPLTRVVVTHDVDHHHGSARVALARTVGAEHVAVLALDPELGEIDYAHALYIDTETTGLSGGTGTLPFLIGMAWFDQDGQLVVEQLLLPRPGLEGPMLARLAERIALASAIVSYNGKSFDWPLLRTRFILNRIAAPKLPPHLDLLHCARRVYKSRLGSVRLVFIEQELMGFERIGDIAGELIPETYLSYLRGSSSGSTLTPIVEHNRSDLIALPALLGELVRRFLGQHERQDARDRLGFAKVAARGAAPEHAIACAHAVVASDARGELASAALFLVGELRLRQDDVVGASLAFERAIEASLAAFERARAHHALAKLHEHKTKQHERALVHAAETAAFEGDGAMAKRVARLQLRLAKRMQRATRARTPAQQPADGERDRLTS